MICRLKYKPFGRKAGFIYRILLESCWMIGFHLVYRFSEGARGQFVLQTDFFSSGPCIDFGRASYSSMTRGKTALCSVPLFPAVRRRNGCLDFAEVQAPMRGILRVRVPCMCRIAHIPRIVSCTPGNSHTPIHHTSTNPSHAYNS